MEMKHLEVFVSVARSLNFSKTAEVLYLSQPTVSNHISALEKELGVQLLIRNTKEVSLTKAGADLFVYAQNILSLKDQAVHSLYGENQEATGSIDIIASTIPAQNLLPEIIASFRREWPNVVFRVDQADSRQVEREMGKFRYDFGLIGTTPDSARFIHYPIYDDELVLVLPNGTAESDGTIRDNLSIYILQVPFIMREAGSGTRSETEAILAKCGINPRDLRVVAYFSDTHSIIVAASHGVGVSLVSKIAATMHQETGRLRVVEMNNPLFRRQIHLLHNKELALSPLQRAFADHCRRFFTTGTPVAE